MYSVVQLGQLQHFFLASLKKVVSNGAWIIDKAPMTVWNNFYKSKFDISIKNGSKSDPSKAVANKESVNTLLGHKILGNAIIKIR